MHNPSPMAAFIFIKKINTSINLAFDPNTAYVKYLYSSEWHKPDDDNVPLPTV